MGNKTKVNALMYELENSIRSVYMWLDEEDEEEVIKASKKVHEIRQEILNIVID